MYVDARKCNPRKDILPFKTVYGRKHIQSCIVVEYLMYSDSPFRLKMLLDPEK
jgi:hypothetical protein